MKQKKFFYTHFILKTPKTRGIIILGTIQKQLNINRMALKTNET